MPVALRHGFTLAYVPLMQDDGTTLRDGNHTLFMYKVRWHGILTCLTEVDMSLPANVEPYLMGLFGSANSFLEKFRSKSSFSSNRAHRVEPLRYHYNLHSSKFSAG